MKKILFASTALASLAIGGAAYADISLFGDARLGVGYNIQNDGTVLFDDADEDDINEELTASEDLRAVSRVRFGVTMTGETDTGITFGATIRADNSGNGQGGTDGQRAGEVFVSGAFGTLTFGDTNGADEQHVGDAGGSLALTGLGDLNETPFVSNGGGFGDDEIDFASNPDARPTVRYDYNFAGFGISASTNRDLSDVGVGASYTFDFGNGGSLTGAAGYYDFNEFTTSGGIPVRGGEQFSVGAKATFGNFEGGVVYTASSSESDDETASGDLDVLNVGLGYTFNEWGVSAFYANVLTGNGNLDVYDGRDAYGIALAYDLGGGASINTGVSKTYGRDGIEDALRPIEDTYVADFGIKMTF